MDFTKSIWVSGSHASFPKEEEHLVTFCSTVAKTQIDYFLLRKDDKGLCKTARLFRVRIVQPNISSWRWIHISSWRWIWRSRGSGRRGMWVTNLGSNGVA